MDTTAQSGMMINVNNDITTEITTMATKTITLTELLSTKSGLSDITAKRARKILRGSSIKHTRGKAWTFTPAQAKAAHKVLVDTLAA